MEKELFKKLFDLHFNDIRRYLFYRSGNEELASDLAQETFLKLWEKDFRIEMKPIKGLLYKIANDLFISNYRREKVAFNFFENFKPYKPSATVEDELNYKELKHTYHKALKSMPEKQRVVFLMNRIDEHKYTDIAELLNISVKTVEYRMSQALKHLKKYLVT